MVRTIMGALACVTLVAVAYAADPMPATQRTAGPDSGMRTGQSLPASKLIGLEVRNQSNEKIGKVEDLVINLADGSVAYVALSHGGVLGIGDKLFAVPFAEMRFNREANTDNMFFALNISKEKLDTAPGFDKDKWPDFANHQWRQQIDQHYRNEAADRIDRTTAKPVVP